jgi:hypothetical protein
MRGMEAAHAPDMPVLGQPGTDSLMQPTPHQACQGPRLSMTPAITLLCLCTHITHSHVLGYCSLPPASLGCHMLVTAMGADPAAGGQKLAGASQAAPAI